MTDHADVLREVIPIANSFNRPIHEASLAEIERLRAGAAPYDELQRRLWALYDAAKFFISYDARKDSNEPAPEQWTALYRAVADVPESQHP